MNTQYVLVEFRNTPPFVYQIKSKNKITMGKVVECIERAEEFNEDRDSLTFIEEPLVIHI